MVCFSVCQTRVQSPCQINEKEYLILRHMGSSTLRPLLKIQLSVQSYSAPKTVTKQQVSGGLVSLSGLYCPFFGKIMCLRGCWHALLAAEIWSTWGTPESQLPFQPKASPSTACFVWGTGLCAPVLFVLYLFWTIGLSWGHYVKTLNIFWKKILPFSQHMLRKLCYIYDIYVIHHLYF